MPAGFALVSAVPSVGFYDPATGRWLIGVVERHSDHAHHHGRRHLRPRFDRHGDDPLRFDDLRPDGLEQLGLGRGDSQDVDLAVTKAVDVARPNVGDVIVLTTRVANAGPGAATGVRILSAAGSGLTFLSSPAGQGTFDPATGSRSWAAVASVRGRAPGHARVDSPDAMASTGERRRADQPDIAPNNDAASVGITPQKADLAPTQSVSNAAPLVGDEVTFTSPWGMPGPTPRPA